MPPSSANTNGDENAPVMKNTFSEHGNEIEEIISNKPPSIVRWGTVYFLFLLLALAAICWFIQYPDVVPAKAKLTSINAPKAVITKQSGKLIKLFAKENELTKQGNILGYLESTANHEDLIKLSVITDSMQILLAQNKTEAAINYFNSFSITSSSQQSSPYFPPREIEGAVLGELQQSFQTFQQSFTNFRNYISGGFYLSKKMMLLKDINFMQKLHNNLLQQKGLNIEDLALSQKTFNANESLKDDKVISELDYRNENSKLINKKLTLPQINSAIISNESQQNEKQKEIMELENTIAQQKSIFSQSLNTLKSQIEEWKKKYLLAAPVDGKIAFATFLQENQQLQTNQIICFINPENSQYYAEVYIPQSNFGKVKTGQEVLLKFYAYPFQEYGSVKGTIDFISNISTDSGYLAKVILPDGLNTNYKKQIQFRDGLTAQGEIITANMRLLQRFYYNIVKQVAR
jgi:multidrug efflux pump subunit AcrA (membrane-fusion protein)